MDKKTGETDLVYDCLSQWFDRARGYHTEVWNEWVGETSRALVQYSEQQAKIAKLVKDAKWAFLDHQLEIVAARLNELGELLK